MRSSLLYSYFIKCFFSLENNACFLLSLLYRMFYLSLGIMVDSSVLECIHIPLYTIWVVYKTRYTKLIMCFQNCAWIDCCNVENREELIDPLLPLHSRLFSLCHIDASTLPVIGGNFPHTLNCEATFLWNGFSRLYLYRVRLLNFN